MRVKERLNRAKRYLESSWRAGYMGRLLFLEILLAFLLVDFFPGFDAQSILPESFFVLGLGVIYFFLINLVRALVSPFLSFFINKPGTELILIVLDGYLLKEVVSSGHSIGPSSDAWTYFIVILSLVAFWGLGHTLWVYGRKKAYTKGKTLGLVLSSLYFILVLSLTLFQGFDRSQNQGIMGEYRNKDYQVSHQVQLINYGPGLEMDFGRENHSNRAYLDKWQGRIRKKILGHDLKDIPYRGRIFLPKNKKRVPFIVFVHGNHRMVEDNMGGYDYLGNFLASQGYGFISIDQSIFNGYMGKGTGNENDARALFLLQHTRKLVEESQRKGSLLYDRINPNIIILGGHSRGGEAAAIASHFNELIYLPDDGEKTHQDPLSIKGVLAVAPTYGQYKPSDRHVYLEDISYLLIHGSHDQDVNSIQGMDQYDRLSFTKKEGSFKAQVLVAKANHGQFNENWGRRDKSLPSGYYLNTRDLLSQRDQEKILQVYALNYLKVLEGRRPSSLFKDTNGLEEWLPSTRYFSRYDNDQSLILANFEEDNRLETGSLPEVEISGQKLSSWTEEAFASSGTKNSQDHVFNGYLGDKNGLKIEYPSTYNRKKEGIRLDLAFSSGPTDIQLLCIDKNGQKSKISAQVKDLYGPESTGLTKWQQVAGEWEEKNSLQTIFFSFEDLEKENPEIDSGSIQRLEILSSPSSQVYLDNIGLFSFSNDD